MTTQELRTKLRQYLAQNNKTVSAISQRTGISSHCLGKVLNGSMVKKSTEDRIIAALSLHTFESVIDVSVLDEDFSYLSYRESLIPNMVKAQKKKEKSKKMQRHPTMANTWILVDR